MENKIKPTVGRIVLFKLSKADADEINKRRDDVAVYHKSYPELNVDTGFQVHVGSPAYAGQVLPMIIVAVWGETLVNGKVFLDGNDDFWALSIEKGEEDHRWDWMPFQKDQAARMAPGTLNESHPSPTTPSGNTIGPK